MKCPICRRADAEIGVLCVSCRDELVGDVAITQEQIQRCGSATSAAALIDVWGGLHRLSPQVTIGRTMNPPALTILEPSVSRRHATIAQTPQGWLVTDLGSAHGTFVDEWSAEQPLVIRTGLQLRVGTVRLFFLDDATGIEAPQTVQRQTHKPSQPIALRTIAQATREIDPIEILPVMTILMHEPTGGGGGVIEVDGKRIQLSLPQYELLALLVRRMLERAHEPQDVRGFFAPAELVGMLSLDSTQADDDNIRQLVHRVRRSCAKAGIRDLIETKYGLGYRLSVTPRIR